MPPGAPERPWRLSGRLLVLDPADRVLVVRSFDPSYPELGQWWEVPGGGVDHGESTLAAALREVLEETGVSVPPSAVGRASWRCELSYLWLGARRWSRQEVYLARLATAPEVTAPLAYTAEERATFLGAEWLPVGELPGRRTFPDGVSLMLPRLLAGETVDAGFSVWC